jgi:predicted transcriptional regulator
MFAVSAGLEANRILSGGVGRRPTTRRRRSSVEIIADMLRVGEGGAGKTEIMCAAKMSYNQMQRYLGYLEGEGFITKMDMGGGATAYRVTDTGLKLLKTIDSLIELLRAGGQDR